MRYFEWQEGYAAFSVSESQVDRVREYVLHQEEHHRTMTVQSRSTWDCFGSTRSRSTNVTFSRRSTLGKTTVIATSHACRPFQGLIGRFVALPSRGSRPWLQPVVPPGLAACRTLPAAFPFSEAGTRRAWPDDCADPQDRARNTRLARPSRLMCTASSPGSRVAGVTQMLRWIEPGAFPDGFAGRGSGTLECRRTPTPRD